jgi:TetR/AcrR family transcriptional repressor of nem operon
MSVQSAPARGTVGQILDVAEQLLQTNGFNGFSYADVAAELSVSKAALHYHFNSKATLGEALITRYAERFTAALSRIDRDVAEPPEKLRAYMALYAAVLSEQRMCLCGMLAAEYQTLPEPMQTAVAEFFATNEEWLARVVDAGKADHSLAPDGSSQDTARLIVSTLEGAMLVARPYGDVKRFEATSAQLLASLRVRRAERD